MPKGIPGWTHGYGGYLNKCRCDICKEAKYYQDQQYKSKNREKLSAKQRAYQQTEKGKLVHWSTNLKYNFNITEEQYNQMIINQGGGCAICGKSESSYDSIDLIKRLGVDHNHNCCSSKGKSCGKCVRGLLCDICNRLVGSYEAGLLKNNTEKFSEYLSKY